MSDETEDGDFEELESDPFAGAGEASAATQPGLDELRSDLYAAIEELGLASADGEENGTPVAGCYLSTVPSDRHGHGGIVVRWLLPDSADAEEAVPLVPIESVDILNEALGPLLLALGFPIEPYSADGRWIVTGPRTMG